LDLKRNNGVASLGFVNVYNKGLSDHQHGIIVSSTLVDGTPASIAIDTATVRNVLGDIKV
jgi:hypothetical protein